MGIAIKRQRERERGREGKSIRLQEIIHIQEVNSMTHPSQDITLGIRCTGVPKQDTTNIPRRHVHDNMMVQHPRRR